MAKNRREEILAAANRVLNAKGMDELSVRNVAAEAGIGASTLRHYFPSQADLFQTVVGSLMNEQISNQNIADSELPPADRLAECIMQFLPATEEHIPGLLKWFAYYQALLDPARSEKEVELSKALTDNARERVSTWLSTLVKEGHQLTLDEKQAASWLLSTADGLCLQLLTPGSPVTLDGAREIVHRTAAAIVK